jgi:hypothetical protein
MKESSEVDHETTSEWLQTRPGERCLIRVSAGDTSGAYSVVEIVADTRDGTPVHVHQNESFGGRFPVRVSLSNRV